MIEIISCDDALFGLYPEWDALWRRVPAKTPFQSPAWLTAWWRQFGTERPVVALAREHGRLVGVLPTYVLAEPAGAKLLPIGVGLSDYNDALIAPDAPGDTAANLLAAVLASADVPVCDLPDLLPDAKLLDVAPPPGWQVVDGPGEPCPVLAVPEGCEGVSELVPAKMRRKLNMNRNRAARAGGCVARASDQSTLVADLDSLTSLHGARWQQQGQAGVLADARVQAFHRDAAPALLASGVLRLTTLQVQDTTAAACLAFAAPPGRLLIYLSGFDDAFAFISPSTLLLAEMIARAMQDGLREVHLLRGNEAYKYGWGGIDRLNTSRHITRIVQ